MLSSYQRATLTGIDLEKEEKNKLAGFINKIPSDFYSSNQYSSVKSNSTRANHGYTSSFNYKNALPYSKTDAKRETNIPKIKLSSHIRNTEANAKRRSHQETVFQNQQACPPRRYGMGDLIPKEKYIITSGLHRIGFLPISPYISGNARDPFIISTKSFVHPSTICVKKLESTGGILNFVVTVNSTKVKKLRPAERLKNDADFDQQFMLYKDGQVIYNSNLNKKQPVYLQRSSSASAIRKRESHRTSASNNGDLLGSAKNVSVNLPEISSEKIISSASNRMSMKLEEKLMLNDVEYGTKIAGKHENTSYNKFLLPKYSSMLAEKHITADEEPSLSETSFLAKKGTEMMVDYKQINDVLVIAGIDIKKEIEYGMEHIGTQIRSCTEEPFLNFPSIISRCQSLCHNEGFEEDALKMLSYGVTDYIKNVIEIVTEHAKESKSENNDMTSDRKYRCLSGSKVPVNRITLNDMLFVIVQRSEVFQSSVIDKAMELQSNMQLDF